MLQKRSPSSHRATSSLSRRKLASSLGVGLSFANVDREVVVGVPGGSDTFDGGCALDVKREALAEHLTRFLPHMSDQQATKLRPDVFVTFQSLGN